MAKQLAVVGAVGAISEPHHLGIRFGMALHSNIIGCRHCLLVEARGIEPLSENLFI